MTSYLQNEWNSNNFFSVTLFTANQQVLAC